MTQEVWDPSRYFSEQQVALVDQKKLFGGWQLRFEHVSKVLQCNMQFSVYLPPQAQQTQVPAVYWLSGLTCTDENFSSKAGAQRVAAELGVALVIPDTSPRGEGVPDDAAGQYDFGLGAGFYVNATQAPWQQHYQMYDYIRQELPALVEQGLPLSAKRGISGHSMGGHGALVIGLRETGRYAAISAFAPICQPTTCAWGEKAFSHYLGDDKKAWANYDASLLLAARKGQMVPPILVDQGTADNFLAEQLNTPALIAANETANAGANIRYQPGYDHSYYFISTFIEEHLRFLAKHLV